MKRVAECIAGLILEEFGAPRVRADVAKEPVLPSVRQVGVIIERVRPRAAVDSFREMAPADELANAG